MRLPSEFQRFGFRHSFVIRHSKFVIQKALLLPALLLTSATAETLTYPDAPREETTYVLHGKTIADPYRWLEELDSEKTREWIDRQNELSSDWLEDAPRREWMQERLEKLWHYDKYGTPHKIAGRLFYTRKSGLQNQGVLYWQPDAPDAEPAVLLDPNLLSEDGTAALSGWSVSDDGKYLAYSISRAGSDWQEWFVREVDTGKDLEDHLQWIKFSSAEWSVDGKGFYYSRYDRPEDGKELEAVNYFQKLYYHRLGSPQSEDALIYQRPDQKEWGFYGFSTEDGRYLVISTRKSSNEERAIFYKDLSAGPDAPVLELISGFTSSYQFIANDDSIFYFYTNKDAPNHRVIAVDLKNPDPGDWREVIPETSNNLEDVSLLGDTFLATYNVDVVNKVFRIEKGGGEPVEIPLSSLGSVWGFRGRRDHKETFYSLTGLTNPATVYRYDVTAGKSTVFKKPDVDFTPADLTSRQVFFESADGTRIPMFLAHRAGLPLDGKAPVYLYGYGGFNVSLTPYFSVSNVLWMELGGVFALANLRGGGEYGERWHKAGMKHKKQTVFDDFIAGAEWLINEGITSSSRLAIGGGSNGGLLVGACINQRPDLFGAAISSVGVHDMLRFHKYTIGWAWTEEFGSPDDPKDFETLYAYSPYHNTQASQPYPPVLITTADHDDRVFPAHSFKFGAALQHAQTGDQPVLMRIETKAGHGAGKPTSKSIEEIVDRWSFLTKALKM